VATIHNLLEQVRLAESGIVRNGIEKIYMIIVFTVDIEHANIRENRIKLKKCERPVFKVDQTSKLARQEHGSVRKSTVFKED